MVICLKRECRIFLNYTLKLSERKIELKDEMKALVNQTRYPAGFDRIRNAKILVAEDEVMNQFLIKKILEPEGFQITIVNNGAGCIDILKKGNNFDLILMDIQMPEMDGFIATIYIRKVLNNNNIKIIGVSANAFIETQEQILSGGMNDFISKPINVNKLFELMVKWIDADRIN